MTREKGFWGSLFGKKKQKESIPVEFKEQGKEGKIHETPSRLTDKEWAEHEAKQRTEYEREKKEQEEKQADRELVSTFSSFTKGDKKKILEYEPTESDLTNAKYELRISIGRDLDVARMLGVDLLSEDNIKLAAQILHFRDIETVYSEVINLSGNKDLKKIISEGRHNIKELEKEHHKKMNPIIDIKVENLFNSRYRYDVRESFENWANGRTDSIRESEYRYWTDDDFQIALDKMKEYEDEEQRNEID